jgi:hypothetical protein
MRRSDSTPSIVPNEYDQNVYLVVDDFGRLGPGTDLETIIVDLLDGQYHYPIGVFGFNTAEGWSRDVSTDVAEILRKRCDLEGRELPATIQDFVARHFSSRRQLTLRLMKPD